MNKIGLIIQGPLVSFGRSGASAAQKLDLLTGKQGLVRYDCRANIQKIIDDFGSLFSDIVISTWDSELKPGDIWKGATLVSMPDPGAVMDDSPRAYKAHNRNRQFIGIKHGLGWLEKNSDIAYVVQMRTDQHTDLRELLDSFGRHLQRRIFGMICAPFMRPGIFLASDFYFASELQAMKNFLDAQMSHNGYEFIVDVHRDMVLKYARFSFRDVLGVPDWAYFPRAPHVGISKETKKIFSFMFQNIFFPLNQRTLRSVMWRGSLLSEDYLNGVITEERLPFARTAVFSVPSIFSINWERYYEFFRIAAYRRLSWKETCIVALSATGWNAWSALLSGIRMIKKKIVWLAKRQ